MAVRAVLPGTFYLEQDFQSSGGWNIVGAVLHDNVAPRLLTPDEKLPDEDGPSSVQVDMTQAWKLEDIPFVEPNVTLACDDYVPEGYVFNEKPLVVYIPYFLRDKEISHLIQISYSPAWVNQGAEAVHDPAYRRSETATLSRDDTVQCIERRAQLLQNWTPEMKLEAISVQRYQPNGFFRLHQDHFGNGNTSPDRFSTFNVYLQDTCKGGGTHFPWLPSPIDERWCEFTVCDHDESQPSGVIFKPTAGGAIYWENMPSTEEGSEKTMHQGLPVESGEKIGMNIWTWKSPPGGQL